MGVNKVEYGGKTLIDLSDSNVTPETLKQGAKAYDKSGELITGTYAPKLQSKSLPPSEDTKIVEPENGYDGLSKVTIEGVGANYIGSAVPRKAAETYIPRENEEQIIAAGQYLSEAQKIAAIPSNYTDTSDATAGEYDVCSEQTAYVKGQKITGVYQYIYPQLNAGSSGCSTSQLVVPCDFTPKACCVILNSASYTSNRIIAMWTNISNVIYHTKTTSSVARTSITSGASGYVSYDASKKQLVLKAASSTYLWGSDNYRVFVFR